MSKSDKELKDLLREVAFHEAGHAVALVALSGPLHSVKISVRRGLFGGLKTFGETYRYSPRATARPETFSLDEAVDFSAMVYAGGLAQGLHRHHVTGESVKRCQKEVVSRWCGADSDTVRYMLKRKSVLMDRAQEEAEDLVSSYWDSIENVAKALERKGRLSGREVRRLA